MDSSFNSANGMPTLKSISLGDLSLMIYSLINPPLIPIINCLLTGRPSTNLPRAESQPGDCLII